MYVGADTDGTEVLVYFNGDAKGIACTEIEPDEGRIEDHGIALRIATSGTH